MTFTTWQNDLDVTRYDPDIVGAVAMVVTGANEVAIASPDSRKIVMVNQRINGEGTITVNKSLPVAHRFTDISFSGGRIYCTCRRTFKDRGHIYIFNKSDVTRPVYSIDDNDVYGPIISQPALSAYLYSRSDRPSLVARAKTDNAVIAEIQTQFKVSKMWGDLTDQGLLYCANQANRVLERVRWSEDAQAFSYIDSIELPYAEGLLDMFVRDGQILYVTNENVVHYNIETQEVKFNYHDFFAGLGSIAPVTAVDFGTLDDPAGHLTLLQGSINIDTYFAGVSADSERKARVDVRVEGIVEMYAGTYRFYYDKTMLTNVTSFDNGVTWTIAGDLPVIGAGPRQGFYIVDGAGTFHPMPKSTGFPGEVSPGVYDTAEHCRDAYDGVYMDIVHPGGPMYFQLWDADSTDNISNTTKRRQAFMVNTLSIDGRIPPIDITGPVPIEGTSLTIYQHPNLDANDAVVPGQLETLEAQRLKGNLSRKHRDRFSYPSKNGFLVEFGEMYGTAEAPFEVQFRDNGPKKIIRTINSAYIFLDPARGVVGFTGSLLFHYRFDRSITRGKDIARGLDVEWKSYLPSDPATPTYRSGVSRIGYPNVPAIWLPGISGQSYGQGKGWNAKFFTGDLTIMAWIRPETNPERVLTHDYQRIISAKRTWRDLTGTFGLVLRANGGEIDPDLDAPFIQAFASGGNYEGDSEVASVRRLDELMDGEWHFVTVMMGQDYGRIYLDTVDVTGYSALGPLVPDAYDLVIGKIAGQDPGDIETAQPDFYRGWLGEIRLYNESSIVARMNDVWEKTRAFYGR